MMGVLPLCPPPADLDLVDAIWNGVAMPFLMGEADLFLADTRWWAKCDGCCAKCEYVWWMDSSWHSEQVSLQRKLSHDSGRWQLQARTQARATFNQTSRYTHALAYAPRTVD